jgi:hypothetical protein
MHVLFDNGVPRGVASGLSGHVVEEARDRGWDRLKNGDLLDAAEAAGFDVFVTTDRNIQYQQNLSKRTLAIVGLSKGSWPLIKHQLSDIASAVAATTPGSVRRLRLRLSERPPVRSRLRSATQPGASRCEHNGDCW